MRYTIIVTKPAAKSLDWIDRKQHRSIRDAILEQLAFEPLVETKNRKPLDPPIGESTWELRCGIDNRFRVLYQVLPSDEETLETIEILAIGEKRGNQLFINGEVIDE